MCGFLEAPGFALPQAEVTVLMGTYWLWSVGWGGPTCVSNSFLTNAGQLIAHLNEEAYV